MEKRIKNKHEIGMKSRNGSLYYEVCRNSHTTPATVRCSEGDSIKGKFRHTLTKLKRAVSNSVSSNDTALSLAF